VLHGPGAGWLPAPEEDRPAPVWTNGRAFPAVWRDSLSFGMGGVVKPPAQFPNAGPGPWNHRPPPGSDSDIEQAIGAKVHISQRILPLLGAADLVAIEPEKAASVPDFADPGEEALYSAEARLPRSPLFLDLEAIDGSPLAWTQETWPLPFFLRGALCWQQEEMFSVIPFGSVGSTHPWGGTDYQAWGRWVFLQGHSAGWPRLGQGDFFARANGEVRSWVDAESESVCAHMGSVTHNLCRRVLTVLMCLEVFEVDLVAEATSRQVRRRAERKGERIGLVPERWPIPLLEGVSEPVPDAAWAGAEAPLRYAPEEDCPIPKSHARLNQCHLMWHEALDAYAEPDRFVGHLNAVIQGLRNVTWVLRKELCHSKGFEDWYAGWEAQMKADARMGWLVSARNRIEKQGDLDATSVAQVRVIGSWLRGPALEIEVEPTTEAHEIARKLQVGRLPSRVLREGVLEVERRWTIGELAGDEILDVLAHCHGFLGRLLEDAHRRWGGHEDPCGLDPDGICEGAPATPHPSGRVPCMVAGRSARTVRRDLSSGALVEIEVQPLRGPEFDPEEMLERYGFEPSAEDLPEEKGAFGMAEMFHRFGRRFFPVDGHLVTVAWLLRDGQILRQISMEPEDQREKYLNMEALADQVERLGADSVIVTTELWQAPPVERGDRRFALRPAERDDRSEAIGTYALRRDGDFRFWHSPIEREGDSVSLGEMTVSKDAVMNPAFFLAPVLAVWKGWEG
jgi:hypothetical protein